MHDVIFKEKYWIKILNIEKIDFLQIRRFFDAEMRKASTMDKIGDLLHH